MYVCLSIDCILCLHGNIYRHVEHLHEYDSHPVRRSPRLSSRYSRADGSGHLFPLTSVTYSATSRQSLSGFKYCDETASANILNESGQSVPVTFDNDVQHSDLPEHLYGMNT